MKLNRSPRVSSFFEEERIESARRRPVSKVMTRRVVAVTPATRVLTAEWVAARRGVHHLLVVDEDRVAGVLGATDLREASAEAEVASCMTTPAIGIHPQATTGEAATLLRERAIGCLPVLANGRLVGILTRRDLLRAGLPVEEIAAPACVACQATEHVRVDERLGDVPFCADCIERAHDDSVELGTVD
jgi:acetoin utilization protein AcuB